MNYGFLIWLTILFAFLLSVRIAFLLILRRDETPRKIRTRHWPDAIVIRDHPEEHPTPTPRPAMNPRMNITDDQLAAFCRRWKIAKAWLFGSVLRDDFRPTSDLDVMIEFSQDVSWTLFDLSQMKFELQDLTGRGVDLLTRRGVESSQNTYRRESILGTAKQVYAA